ncbi:MAG TPA: EboA domain-containing protein [Streptosporangiaceae bacterium]|nr:EboA domain-containing protein [Streptosporangiaceae bacterium]
MTLEKLTAALAARLTDEGAAWLAKARVQVSRDPAAIHVVSPAAGRHCGRGRIEGLRGGWTVDDAVRALLIAELPLGGAALTEAIEELYWHGDAAEKRGVLRALSVLESRAEAGDGSREGFGDAFVPLVHDAVRTNDTRLIAAALGPYGARHLDAAAYRQAVLKCLFTGIPLADISGVEDRVDDELVRMMSEFAQERISAGRVVPDDVWRFVPSPEA